MDNIQDYHGKDAENNTSSETDSHGASHSEADSYKPLMETRVYPVEIVAQEQPETQMGSCLGPRCCGISGLVVAIFGAILAATFPLIYHSILNHELSLQPGTIMYGMWENAPVDMYIRFYLFNVTNSGDVEKNQAKPILQELGPYTFRERHFRVHIEHFNNHTMKFQQRRTWNFMPELSNGTLQDNVTTLNVPIVSATSALRFSPLWFRIAFNQAIKLFKSELFVTKTSGQLLFDGYDDPLLNFSQHFPEGMFPPYDKFGWFYLRNNSDYYDGVFNVYDGSDDIGKMGVMDMWNFTKNTRYYESYCGMVNGSFGEAWPPYRDRTSISLYTTDLCRSVTLDYKKDVQAQGMTFYRFAGTHRLFANTTDNPDNWCFCSGGVCNPSGVVNSSTCRYGAPAFVSFPHFFQADPFYLNQVEGLDPQEDLHEFHIDLEPQMSVPLAVRARFQINILMEPVEDITIIENVKRTFVPVLWFEVSADLTKDVGWWLHLALQIPVIGTASFFSVFCIGMISVAISGVVFIKRRDRNRLTVNNPKL